MMKKREMNEWNDKMRLNHLHTHHQIVSFDEQHCCALLYVIPLKYYNQFHSNSKTKFVSHIKKSMFLFCCYCVSMDVDVMKDAFTPQYASFKRLFNDVYARSKRICFHWPTPVFSKMCIVCLFFLWRKLLFDGKYMFLCFYMQFCVRTAQIFFNFYFEFIWAEHYCLVQVFFNFRYYHHLPGTFLVACGFYTKTTPARK